MGSGTERVDPIHARRLTRGEHVVDRTPSWQGGRSEKEEGFETIGGWVGEIFFPPIGSFDSPEPVRTGTARHRTRSSRTAEDLRASGSHPRRFTDLPSRLAPLLASCLPFPWRTSSPPPWIPLRAMFLDRRPCHVLFRFGLDVARIVFPELQSSPRTSCSSSS